MSVPAQIMADGFTPGVPPYLPGKALLADRQMVREMKCPECSHHGLSYAPFRRGFRYRAVASCPRCQRFAEEV
jgi:hypothetical protein